MLNNVFEHLWQERKIHGNPKNLTQFSRDAFPLDKFFLSSEEFKADRD